MGTSQSTKYKNDFIKANYDRLNIQVPKGRKELIERHYKSQGYTSLNSYINALINADMNLFNNTSENTLAKNLRGGAHFN